ncbi:MAG: PepSY-associated TM helix domain-containing protein [Paludibacter sp.]
MNRKKIRTLHATLGYFYVGLIISFALSGLFMNHRQSWHPDKYTIEKKEIVLDHPIDEQLITDEFVAGLIKKQGIDDKVRRHNLRKGELRISCANYDIDIELKTGKAEITKFVKTPLVSHIMDLHKNISVWWIYYSDAFAISLIIIAVTGLMMKSPSPAARKRIRILVVSGLLFPLLFVFVLSLI